MSLFMGIVGDGRGWLVVKILRGDGGSYMAWVESRGAVLDRRNGGRTEGKKRIFLLFFFFR